MSDARSSAPADRLRGLFDRYGGMLTLLALAGVTVLSLSPKNSIGDPGSADRTAHFLAYAAIMLPVALSPRRLPLVAAAIIAWSGAIELIQPYVGRSASLADLATNAVGVLGGVSLGRLGRFLLRNRSG